MKLIAVCAALASVIGPVFAQPSRDMFFETPTTDIMIVGTFHFHQTNTPNVLEERHQQGIEAIVSQLAEFAPTIVGLECTGAEEALINEQFRAWLAGEHELTKNERQQIGFRLGRAMGHEKLHCVDADHPPAPNFDAFDGWDEFMTYAKERGEYAGFEIWIPLLETYVAEARDFMAEASIAEIMNWHNTVDADQAPARNLMIEVTVGVDDSWAGADWLGRFEGRNVRIFARTQKLASPEDRVLILVGNGHKRPLEGLFGDSYEFNVVETPAF